MNAIHPIAKLGDQVLFINKSDIPYIGMERAMEVKCVKADLNNKVIEPPYELELHLKFNPWEETDENMVNEIMSRLKEKFSAEEILEKLEKPLSTIII